MKSKIGDLILYKDGTGWLSKAIRKLTNSQYNHIGIYVGKGYILEALIKGVKLTNVLDPDTYTGIDRYRLKTGLKCTHQRMVRVVEKYLDRPYSVFDLVKIWLRIKTGIMFKKESRRLICSETVSRVYRDLGHDLFPGKNLDYITPEDFVKHKKLRKV